jgi:hypothetical protein
MACGSRERDQPRRSGHLIGIVACHWNRVLQCRYKDCAPTQLIIRSNQSPITFHPSTRLILAQGRPFAFFSLRVSIPIRRSSR